MVDTNQMNLYKLLPLPFKQEQCGQFSRITMGNPLGLNLTTTPKRVFTLFTVKKCFIGHFTQPSSAAKSGYATRRSVSDFPMSPVLCEQRRESASGGQVNSCPFGSFCTLKG